VIYLIGEIAIYLIAALLLGVGAGWLLRGVRLRTGADGATLAPPFAEPVPAPSVHTARIAELEAQLADARAQTLDWQSQCEARETDLQSLSRRLSALSRQVEELQRERALQTRAVQVLHQQLELALERREPRKGRASGTAA
jgi:hypothetical protein